MAAAAQPAPPAPPHLAGEVQRVGPLSIRIGGFRIAVPIAHLPTLAAAYDALLDAHRDAMDGRQIVEVRLSQHTLAFRGGAEVPIDHDHKELLGLCSLVQQIFPLTNPHPLPPPAPASPPAPAALPSPVPAPPSAPSSPRSARGRSAPHSAPVSPGAATPPPSPPPAPRRRSPRRGSAPAAATAAAEVSDEEIRQRVEDVRTALETGINRNLHDLNQEAAQAAIGAVAIERVAANVQEGLAISRLPRENRGEADRRSAALRESLQGGPPAARFFHDLMMYLVGNQGSLKEVLKRHQQAVFGVTIVCNGNSIVRAYAPLFDTLDELKVES